MLGSSEIQIEDDPLLMATKNIQLSMCLASLLFVRLNLDGESDSKNMLNVKNDIDRIKQYFVKLKTVTEKPKIRINKEASERVILHNISKKTKL